MVTLELCSAYLLTAIVSDAFVGYFIVSAVYIRWQLNRSSFKLAQVVINII